MLPVPEDLRRRARTVGNGEMFWPLSVAPAVARALAAAGLAICGGEVYVGRGRTWGNLELEWLTEPGPQTNVERGLAAALAALDRARDLFPYGSTEDVAEAMCFFAIDSDELR